MDDNKINVGGRLHSIATGNVLVGADEIFDDDKNKKQSDINTETYVLVNEVNEKLATLSPEQQSALAVATKANKNEANLGYYVCDTESNIAAKVVANATGYILEAGGSIKIKMNNANTADNVTLNINSTGAKPLYYCGKIASATNTWEDGETVEVYYDGINFYANNIVGCSNFATGEKIKNVGIDDEPTADSDNLVKSGGIQNEFALGAVYDVSAHNGGAVFESLSALLSNANLNTLIPTAVRKGGMSIKFIQSSNNRYVQYFLKKNEWSTITSDWEKINLESELNQLGRTIEGIRNDADLIGAATTILQDKTDTLKSTEEDLFTVSDGDGNIAMFLDGNGNLDALGIGNNLKNKIDKQIEDNKTILSRTSSIKSTKERQLSIVDKRGNIAWYIKPVVTDEDGTYFVDEQGNIGAKIKNGAFSIAGLSGENVSINDVAKTQNLLAATKKESLNLGGLLALNNNADTIKTVTISNDSAKKKMIVRLFLHTCATHFSEDTEDVFFDGNCENDFSDVRVYYNGKPCKAQFGKLFNGEIVRDVNVSTTIGFLSDGRGFGIGVNGIFIATNNLATKIEIPGTGDGFTEHSSVVYHRTRLWPLQVVDANDNIFAYAGGKLYRINASSNYTTWDEICDFSQEVDGVTIYPDIQPHGLDIDSSGRIYFGPYQEQFFGKLYVSDTSGENFILKYNKDKDCEQHIHHIHYSASEDRVYASFDCNQVVAGPITIYTEDGGNTWVHLEEEFVEFRGRDYWPMYFGNGFKIGSGETNINGDALVLRTETINGNDVNMKVAVPGNGCGVPAGFDDKNIFVGVRANKGFYNNSILYSTDFGRTYDRIWSNMYSPNSTSGQGFRQNSQYPITISGDTKQCLVMGLTEQVNKRIYLGGDDYCRELFVEIDDVPAEDVVLTVKNKHLFEYPYENIFGSSILSAWELPLNEGIGNAVSDGYKTYQIEGHYNWYDGDKVFRYGELAANNYFGKGIISSAIKLMGGSYINTGKHPEINTNKNFSITFWLNGDRSRFRTSMPDDIYASSFTNLDHYTHILKWGNCKLWIKGLNIGIQGTGGNTMSYPIDGMNVLVSSTFYFVAITFGEDSSDIHISLNAVKDATMGESNLVVDNIGTNDLIICNDYSDEEGMYISDIRVYDKKLSFDEVKELYYGYNV